MSIQTTTISLKSIPLAGLMALALCGGAAAQVGKPQIDKAQVGTFQDGVAALDRADYAHALRIFSDAAAQGDAKSQFAIAEMYRQGQGARQDDRQAVGWYRRAAEQGLPGAEFRLALAYQTGQGVRRDDRQAEIWYAKAASEGYDGVRERPDDTAADAKGTPRQRFFAMMDRVFGAGRWRETSGYRSPAQEDELRRQGAGTVPVGQRSLHSVGNVEAPGAYDIVVSGMPLQLAAAKLKVSGEPLARVFAEAAHGAQGPHLHVEPKLLRVSARVSNPAPGAAEAGWGRLGVTQGAPARLIATSSISASPRD